MVRLKVSAQLGDDLAIKFQFLNGSIKSMKYNCASDIDASFNS